MGLSFCVSRTDVLGLIGAKVVVKAVCIGCCTLVVLQNRSDSVAKRRGDTVAEFRTLG